MIESKIDPLVHVVLVKKGKYVVYSFSFSFAYSVLLLGFLLVNGVWLALTTMNANAWENEGMINLTNNAI